MKVFLRARCYKTLLCAHILCLKTEKNLFAIPLKGFETIIFFNLKSNKKTVNSKNILTVWYLLDYAFCATFNKATQPRA